ncbi:hypothetical protein BHE74_00042647 [Ensete ventricosum]|nr:hypothetical protein BHE74_00042647 [Ensete ventricosum]
MTKNDGNANKKLKIAIIHPDLGIGQSLSFINEADYCGKISSDVRILFMLIVDAAVQLASHGHSVHLFTSHHDKNRCFEETVAGEYVVSFVI